MTIGDVCDFKTNFEKADFWLQRKGSDKTVGTPTKEFSPENIGVRITDNFRDRIDPNYLFYYFQFLHQKGVFEPIATGTLALKNVKISDIRTIPISFK